MKYLKILKIYLLIIFTMQIMQAGTSGKISGIVLDEKNQPLVGCNVIIKNTMLGAATNLDGEYFILNCLLYTSPSPRDGLLSRMPSSA